MKLSRTNSQLDFYKLIEQKKSLALSHGGELSIGKRKTRRPLDRKRDLHVVLRSSRAQGRYSMLKTEHFLSVKRITTRLAKKFSIKIKSAANVGNHVHLHVRFYNKVYFQNFLRALAGLIARAVTGARKGKRFGKFWDLLAFSRVLRSAYEQKILARYIVANRIEAGRGRDERERFLRSQRGKTSTS